MRTPAVTYSVLPEVENILKVSDVTLTKPILLKMGVINAGVDLTGYDGKINVADGDQFDLHSDPFKWSTALPNGFKWRIVLMDTFNAPMAQPTYADGIRGYRFRIRVDVVKDNVDEIRADKFLQIVHSSCKAALQYKEINLTDVKAQTAMRQNTQPTRTFTDDNHGYRFSSAEYIIGLEPVYTN